MWDPDATHERIPVDRSLTLIVIAVFALTLFYYGGRADTIAVVRGAGLHSMTGPVRGFATHNLAALGLLGLLPLVSGCLLCGMRPGEVGLGAGRIGAGLRWLAVGVPIALAMGRLSAGKSVMCAVYPLGGALEPGTASFLPHVLGQVVYYVSWELLFRGVLLFGLESRLGFAGANTVQTALSTLAHFGRPLPETIIAIPAGLAFGGIAGHTRSIWYVVAIHLAVGAAQDWFIVN